MTSRQIRMPVAVMRALLGACLMAGLASGPAAAWGSAVHRLVSRAAATRLATDCAWFSERSGTLEQLASEADRRRCCDPAEGPRHYIDIDDYPAFFTGTLPQQLDAMIADHGERRVMDNGILPWVIVDRTELLEQYLALGDWESAVAVAADIGHYVADLHEPLHLTVNYDGQRSGQRGIHSRFESQMTGRHLGELEPAVCPTASRTIAPLAAPLDAVFAWIDLQYPGVELILETDRDAVATAGDVSGSAYYDLLWDALGGETRAWVERATVAVAGLWYAAWLRASGAPFPVEIVAPSAPRSLVLHPVVPNPFNPSTQIRFDLPAAGRARLTIHDASGRRVRSILDGPVPLTGGVVTWGGVDDDGTPLASGVYFIRLEMGEQIVRRKAVLVH